MTYFFADIAGLAGFYDLGEALRSAGRMPYVLPPVERGVYGVQEMNAAPRIKIGADVLPWWPASGVYLIVEQGHAAATGLADVPGVAGTWSALAVPVDSGFSTAEVGQRITYCFLDGDPVATAKRLRPVLERRWSDTGVDAAARGPVPHRRCSRLASPSAVRRRTECASG